MRPPALCAMRWLMDRPSPVPLSFVVKNGQEDVREHLLGDPGAVVGDVELDERLVRARARSRAAPEADARRDHHLAPALHGLDGVAEQVHQHLPQLLGIDGDAGEIGIQRDLDLELPRSRARSRAPAWCGARSRSRRSGRPSPAPAARDRAPSPTTRSRRSTSSRMIPRNSRDAASICALRHGSASSCAAPLIAPSGFLISCASPAAIWPRSASRSRSFICA